MSSEHVEAVTFNPPTILRCEIKTENADIIQQVHEMSVDRETRLTFWVNDPQSD